MKLPPLAASAALLLVAVSANSLAAPVVYDNLGNFQNDAGSLTLQDFNGDFTGNNTNTAPLSFDGFTVTETEGTPNLHKFTFGSFEFLHFQSDDPSTVVFNFDSPINAFGVTTVDFAREIGLELGVEETITYRDNAPGSVDLPILTRVSDNSTGVMLFLGVIDDENTFDQVSLTFSTGVTTQTPFNGDDVGLENLEFGTVAAVPLPPAFGLLAVSTLGLGVLSRRGARRRRERRS